MTRHEQVKALRKQSRQMRLDMKRLGFDHLRVMLTLRTLQCNENACNRIQRELTNLLNKVRPGKAAKASKP